MQRLFAFLKILYPGRAKRYIPGKYHIAAVVLLILTVVVLLRSQNAGSLLSQRTKLLEMLPDNGPGIPAAVISALEGEFPEDLARLIYSGRAASSAIISPLMPILDSSVAMAMVITLRGDGPAAYGVFTPALEEYDSLRSGVVPDGWKYRFTNPELLPTDRKGLFQLIADDMPAPLYIIPEDDVSFVADSLFDVDRIMDVRNGVTEGIKRKWAVSPERRGHVFFSDGGALRARVTGSETPNPREALELEVAWTTSRDIRVTRADWRLQGAENFVAKSFLNSFKKDDWSQVEVFMPDPLVAAIGANLPDPGRAFSALPLPLKYFAEQLRQMGLRTGETESLLTGRTTFSVGGRTQVLWFDLPGLVLDMSGRGEVSFKMIEKFWSEKFFGVEPESVEGFDRGGITYLPFTVLAAANKERALLGLVAPDAEQSNDAREIVASATDAAAWLYLDFPRLGASLADIPALNSMLYEEDEETPLDEESANSLAKAMSALGRVFVICESGTSGTADCYY